jgi:hypothetical protein
VNEALLAGDFGDIQFKVTRDGVEDPNGWKLLLETSDPNDEDFLPPEIPPLLTFLDEAYFDGTQPATGRVRTPHFLVRINFGAHDPIYVNLIATAVAAILASY